MSVAYVLAVVATVVVAAVPAAAQERTTRTIVRLADPAAPPTVAVRVFWGTVTVRAGERSDVVVEASAHAVPAIDEARNLVTITGRASEVVNLVIDVPVRTDLRIAKTGPNTMRQASSAGPIAVYGVDGTIEIDTIGGAVSLADVSGSVVAHSRTGSVTARLLRLAPGRAMAFTSYGGDVTVTLPREIRANVIARSHRGRLVSDFDIGSGTQPAQAAVNGGGPEIELRSFAGSVFLRKGH